MRQPQHMQGCSLSTKAKKLMAKVGLGAAPEAPTPTRFSRKTAHYSHNPGLPNCLQLQNKVGSPRPCLCRLANRLQNMEREEPRVCVLTNGFKRFSEVGTLSNLLPLLCWNPALLQLCLCCLLQPKGQVGACVPSS
jgi:hypothetical protein